jgi:hypothetical protein
VFCILHDSIGPQCHSGCRCLLFRGSACLSIFRLLFRMLLVGHSSHSVTIAADSVSAPWFRMRLGLPFCLSFPTLASCSRLSALTVTDTKAAGDAKTEDKKGAAVLAEMRAKNPDVLFLIARSKNLVPSAWLAG